MTEQASSQLANPPALYLSAAILAIMGSGARYASFGIPDIGFGHRWLGLSHYATNKKRLLVRLQSKLRKPLWKSPKNWIGTMLTKLT
jgi:hypothetical protein